MSLEGIVPGSSREIQIVRFIEDFLGDLLDDVYIIEVPVHTWSWRCTLLINGVEKPCVLLPYSPGLELTINPEEILIIENIDSIRRRNIEDKVVLVNYPESPVELRFIINLINGYNPRLILLKTELPGLLKADVVLGSPGYTYKPTVPMKTPVVSLDETAAREIITRGGGVRASSSIRNSNGRIVVGYLNGDGELNVHIIAHHDTIIGDFKSSSSYYLLKLVEKFKNRNPPVNITFVSYTAREIGDAEFTEYHYNWGERFFLRILESKGELEKTAFMIAIGPIHMSGELKAAVHPVLRKYLLNKNVATSEDAFLLESYSYMEHGIPSITFTTGNSLRYRNSNVSFDIKEAQKTMEELLVLIEVLLNSVKPSNEWIKDMHEHIVNKLGESELEVRIEATRLIDLLYQLPIPENIRAITRTTSSIFYYFCLQPRILHAESSLLSNLSKVNMNLLGEVMATCRDYLLFGDIDDYLILSSTREFVDQFLNLLVKHNVKKLRSIINNELIKITCNKLVRCHTDVKESNRDR